MNFAICNETFGDWPFERAFGFARECGYEGIEIAPFTIADNARDISPERRDEIRRQADRAGLEVVGLHWLLAKTEGYYLTTPDAEVRRRTSEYFAELAGLCNDLGGRVMVLGSPQQRNLLPGVSHEQAIGYAAECIRAAVPALERRDVTLAVEPLAPAETDFLTTAEQAVELIERVGSPRVRLHLDVKAMSSEAAPVAEVIRAGAAFLAHVHANDPNLRGPGMGETDFVPIFAALREINYRGWVSVEVFDYTPGAERLARESIDYMKRCLQRCSSKLE